MNTVRVTKEFRFEMAHALRNYDGLCKNIHGHSYILFVTVKGQPQTGANNHKQGMLIDFGDLKRIVNQHIVDVLDHAFLINKLSEQELPEMVHEMFEKTVFVDFQPTCENLVIDFANKLKKVLPRYVTLHSIKLHETATSFAEWYADDNK